MILLHIKAEPLVLTGKILVPAKLTSERSQAYA